MKGGKNKRRAISWLSFYVASKTEFLKENYLIPHLLEENNGNKIFLVIYFNVIL